MNTTTLTLKEEERRIIFTTYIDTDMLDMLAEEADTQIVVKDETCFGWDEWRDMADETGEEVDCSWYCSGWVGDDWKEGDDYRTALLLRAARKITKANTNTTRVVFVFDNGYGAEVSAPITPAEIRRGAADVPLGLVTVLPYYSENQRHQIHQIAANQMGLVQVDDGSSYTVVGNMAEVSAYLAKVSPVPVYISEEVKAYQLTQIN